MIVFVTQKAIVTVTIINNLNINFIIKGEICYEKNDYF